MPTAWSGDMRPAMALKGVPVADVIMITPGTPYAIRLIKMKLHLRSRRA
jgi:hypothetical protein